MAVADATGAGILSAMTSNGGSVTVPIAIASEVTAAGGGVRMARFGMTADPDADATGGGVLTFTPGAVADAVAIAAGAWMTTCVTAC
jgi:hypothetical protein